MSANPFKLGDKVLIRPEWQDEGDDQFQRVVIESPEGSDRVLVQTDIPTFSIKPTEWIPIRFLSKAPD